jgi:hypothetical protein
LKVADRSRLARFAPTFALVLLFGCDDGGLSEAADRSEAATRQGDFAAARLWAERAAERAEAKYGADHFKTATALTLVGETHLARRAYGAAEAPLARALAICEKRFGAGDARAQETRAALAEALTDQAVEAMAAERWAEAEAMLQRLAQIAAAGSDEAAAVQDALATVRGRRVK